MSYELFISRASPYSSKAAALLRYAGVDYQLRIQNGINRFTVIRRLSGQTMVPMLRRGDWAINDSTAIAEYALERTARPLLPGGPQDILAWFLEDFADEWIVRWMVYSRWANGEDAEHVAQVIGEELTGKIPLGSRWVGRKAARMIQGQLKSWGITEENCRALEASMERSLAVLEAIFSSGPPFLFGNHPTVADFSFYGPLVQYGRDPSGRRRLRNFPAIRQFLERLEAVAEQGPADREDVAVDGSRLTPLFAEVIGTYWPLMSANHRVREEDGRGQDVIVDLVDGSRFRCRPSGYLQQRLKWWLGQVDGAYAERDELFGPQGLRMERALMSQIAELGKSETGRKLLRSYEHLGLH